MFFLVNLLSEIFGIYPILAEIISISQSFFILYCRGIKGHSVAISKIKIRSQLTLKMRLKDCKLWIIENSKIRSFQNFFLVFHSKLLPDFDF